MLTLSQEMEQLRIQSEHRKRNSPEYKYNILVAIYEMHCRAYNLNPKSTASFKKFLQADYGKEYNVRLIKKQFAERYFNYNFKTTT